MIMDESVPVVMEISDVEIVSRSLLIFVLISPSSFVRVALAVVRRNNMWFAIILKISLKISVVTS